MGTNKDAAIKKRFAQRLNALMLEKGWNQSELGRRADMGRDSVNGYIRGHNLPNANNLDKLAKALNVAPQSLMGDEVFESRFPAMIRESKLKIEQLADRPDQVNLTINQQVPADVALQIMSLIRQGKKSLT